MSKFLYIRFLVIKNELLNINSYWVLSGLIIGIINYFYYIYKYQFNWSILIFNIILIFIINCFERIWSTLFNKKTTINKSKIKEYSTLPILKLIFLIIIGFIIGIFRSQFFYWLPNKEQVNNISSYKEIIATITDEPKYKSDKSEYIIKDNQSKIRILITTNKFPLLVNGEIIKTECKLENVQNMKVYKNFSFDYKKYLQQNNIHYLCKYPKYFEVIDLKSNKNSLTTNSQNQQSTLNRNFLEKLNYKSRKFKLYLWNILEKQMPYPYADLALSMTLGWPLDLGYLNETFKANGLSHISSVSGFNVMLFTSGINNLLKPFGKKYQQIGSFLMILMFFILAGNSIPALRAGIFALIILINQNFGIQVNKVNTICISIIILLLIDPASIFSISLYLSVCAILGILWLTNPLEIFCKISVLKLAFYLSKFSIIKKIYPSLNNFNYWFISTSSLKQRNIFVTLYFVKTKNLFLIFKKCLKFYSFKNKIQKIHLHPKLDNTFNLLKDNLALTFIAIISTSGVMLYSFGQISIISLISNFLTLWIIEYIGILSITLILFLLLYNLAFCMNAPIFKSIVIKAIFLILSLIKLALIICFEYLLAITTFLYKYANFSYNLKFTINHLIIYYFCIIILVIIINTPKIKA